jgi:hypothetical protein
MLMAEKSSLSSSLNKIRDSVIISQPLAIPSCDFVTLIGIFWLWGICAMAADGLIVVPSSYGPKETMDRLVTEVTARGLTIFARKITLQAPRKEAFP